MPCQQDMLPCPVRISKALAKLLSGGAQGPTAVRGIIVLFIMP